MMCRCKCVHSCFVCTLQLPSCSECNISRAVWRLCYSYALLFQSHTEIWSWQEAISCRRYDNIDRSMMLTFSALVQHIAIIDTDRRLLLVSFSCYEVWIFIYARSRRRGHSFLKITLTNLCIYFHNFVTIHAYTPFYWKLRKIYTVSLL